MAKQQTPTQGKAEKDPSKKYEMWKMEKGKYDSKTRKWSLEKVKKIKDNVVILEQQAKEFNMHSQQSLKVLFPQETSVE